MRQYRESWLKRLRAEAIPMRTLRRPLVAGLLLGAAAVVTGVAIAVTTGIADVNSSVQPVTACIHQGNSQLRIVGDPSLCGGDTAVTWNATVGSLVSPSVGDVFTTSQPADQLLGLGHFTKVSHLALPSGSYVVTAKLEARAGDAGDGTETVMRVNCLLIADADVDGAVAQGRIPSPGGAILAETDMPMTLQLAHVFAGPGEAQLYCSHESRSAADSIVATYVANVRMTAIAV